MILALLIAVPVVAAVAAGLQLRKGRPLEAMRILCGGLFGAAAYAGLLMHQPWIPLIATVLAVPVGVAYVVLTRREAARAAAAVNPAGSGRGGRPR